jgi:hypothetical protein
MQFFLTRVESAHHNQFIDLVFFLYYNTPVAERDCPNSLTFHSKNYDVVTSHRLDVDNGFFL